MLRQLAALGCAVALAAPASVAQASYRVAVGATDPRLAVSPDGRTALVTYRLGGVVRHVLAWGAVDARPPNASVPQVRFTIDYTGGWKSKHRPGWKGFRNSCRRYDGPPLAAAVAACKAPDGSYWALQRWQPKLPHRGYPPYRPGQTAWELDLSHWTGAPAELEVHADWAFLRWHDLFGRLTYRGVPVHGFHTVSSGGPADGYGRGLYIDTLDSAYGPGWKRETSIVFRNPSGVFCYAFLPTHDVSLPGHPARPAGKGRAYRIEVVGPGVTPNLVSEVRDPGDYDPSDPAKVAYERHANRRLLQLAAGDRFCPSQQ
jgi:hypothetical protein